MSHPYPCQAVLIEGPDAMAFAHNQFTSDVLALPIGQWQFSSWLDAQGRVRTLFHLAHLEHERLLLLLRGGDAMAFTEALGRFVFRSRIRLTIENTRSLTTGPASPLHWIDIDNNVIQLGCGTHSMQWRNNVSHDNVSHDNVWQVDQLRAGWPWLTDNTVNEVLAPALSLHRLGAIALDKGCYPGQEIVARLHYRGGNKRHLHHVQLSKTVVPGQTLQRHEQEFVQLLNVISHGEHTQALAVMTDNVADQLAQSLENTSDDGVIVQLINSWPN